MRATMEPTKWTGRLAWGLCLLTLVCIAITIGLAIVNRDSIGSPGDADILEIILPFGFAILGAMVVSRQPHHALGWVFLAIAVCQAIPGPANQYTRYVQNVDPQAPFTPWITWIGEFAANLTHTARLAEPAM